MQEVKEFVLKYKYIFLFVFGICLLYLRSSYNLTHPILYAEEGKWFGQMLQHGFSWTVINGRNDYFIFYLALMLKVADIININLFNGNLSYLPYIIAIMSYIFITLVAILPFLTLGERLNKWGKIFLYFGILLMPMGYSSTEIIGRILQFHFYMWIIAFCLLTYRYDNKDKRKWLILLVDLLILGAIATTPSILLLVFVYALIELFMILKKYFKDIKFNFNRIKEMVIVEINKYSTRQMFYFFIATFALGLILILKMHNAQMDFEEGGNTNNIIEFLVRSISYIFIWPFYGDLDNKSGLIVLICTVIFFIINYFILKNNSKKYYLLTLLSMFAITIITLSSRYFLTNHLYGFNFSAIPDRYYLLMNMTSLFPVAIIISDGFRKIRKLLELETIALIAYFLVIGFINKNIIFQGEKNYLDWLGVSYRERLQNSYDNNKINEDGTIYTVDIDPNWTMEVPTWRMEMSIKNGVNNYE